MKKKKIIGLALSLISIGLLASSCDFKWPWEKDKENENETQENGEETEQSNDGTGIDYGPDNDGW